MYVLLNNTAIVFHSIVVCYSQVAIFLFLSHTQEWEWEQLIYSVGQRLGFDSV